MLESKNPPIVDRQTRIAAVNAFAETWDKGCETSSLITDGWTEVGQPRKDTGGSVTFWENQQFPGVRIGLSEQGVPLGSFRAPKRCFDATEQWSPKSSKPNEYRELK